MKKLLLTLLLLFITISSYSQVVNIENRRYYNESTLITGSLKLSFTLIKNINSIVNYNESFDIQIHKNKHKLLLIGDNIFIKVDQAIGIKEDLLI